MTADELEGIPVSEGRLARVLVVDDDESIRGLVTQWTDMPGYQVKAASSAEAALLIMHVWTADVVVCDIRMPRYNGVWLIEHLRSLYPSTNIIVATGYGQIDPSLVPRARITGYLAKPYDRETLMASLDTAMQSRRGERSESESRLSSSQPPKN